MNIKTIVVGPLQTNCYILEKGNTCLIIDPGDEPEKIISEIGPNMKVGGIIVTHSHDDHIGAVSDIMVKYRCRLYNINTLNHGENLLENFYFDCIPTLGHKDDCITLWFKDSNVMFCGDFIFKDGIGRTDLPGSSAIDMKKSILKILEYPKDIILYPGHGQPTVLGDEINNLNCFLDVL